MTTINSQASTWSHIEHFHPRAFSCNPNNDNKTTVVSELFSTVQNEYFHFPNVLIAHKLVVSYIRWFLTFTHSKRILLNFCIIWQDGYLNILSWMRSIALKGFSKGWTITLLRAIPSYHLTAGKDRLGGSRRSTWIPKKSLSTAKQALVNTCMNSNKNAHGNSSSRRFNPSMWTGIHSFMIMFGKPKIYFFSKRLLPVSLTLPLSQIKAINIYWKFLLAIRTLSWGSFWKRTMMMLRFKIHRSSHW